MTDLLSIVDAARRIGVSTRTLMREHADGRLAITRIRSRRFIALTELERYIAAQQEVRCPSAELEIAGKYDFALAVERALSEHFRQEPSGPTRKLSKARSAARRSTLHVVGRQDT